MSLYLNFEQTEENWTVSIKFDQNSKRWNFHDFKKKLGEVSGFFHQSYEGSSQRLNMRTLGLSSGHHVTESHCHCQTY